MAWVPSVQNIGSCCPQPFEAQPYSRMQPSSRIPRAGRYSGDSAGYSGASEQKFDKVRVLRTEDVKYGRPQYFQHVVLDSGPDALPYAHNPFRSGENTQHLVAFRSKDTKVLGISHPEYGYSGRVFVQEAFDKKGRLRKFPGEEIAQSGPVAQAVPSDESNGSIFLHIGGHKGESKVADSVEIVRGVPTAFSKARPHLSERLSKAAALGLSRTVQEIQEACATPPLRTASRSTRTPQSTPKAGRRRRAGGADTEAQDDILSQSAINCQSPAHRRLFSSQGAGPEHATDKVMENVLAIFEEKAPGQRSIPIRLDSVLGKLAMTSGEIGLEGCGYIESPFTTARSEVPSKFDNVVDMAEVDAMLRALVPPQRTISKRLANLSEAGGSQLADNAVKHEREWDGEEKELKRKAAELSADLERRSRRVDFLEKDVTRCEKEETIAKRLLQDLLDVLDPLKAKMDEVNYKVDAQKKILDKYKKEHGEKGIYKTLRKEINDESNTVQDVKDEVAKLEPKEKSKRKQFEEKQRQTEEMKKDYQKIHTKFKECQKLADGAKGDVKNFRSMKKLRLAELVKDSDKLSSSNMDPNLRPSADTHNSLDSVEGGQNAGQYLGHHDDKRNDNIEHKAANAPHCLDEYDGAEDPNVHKAFSSSASWMRRYAMAARAKSPRWRDRLLKEVEVWKLANVDKHAIKVKYTGTEPLHGAPPSAFITKLTIPVALSRRWETFCRSPPAPFDNCTAYQVVYETRSMLHVQVTFATEPKGFLHAFILAFKQKVLSDDDIIFADQISVLSKNLVETMAFTSLRERWAREGLVSDHVCDIALLNDVSQPRPEERWNLNQVSLLETLVQELSEKADARIIEKIGLFKEAPVALVEALVQIVTVLWVPAHTKMLDQGSIGDAMYYVVYGSLLKRYVQGPRGITVGQVAQGECFCECRLIEMGPNDTTVETLEACKLYRFKTKLFLSILSPFTGFYNTLIKLSWKREAEWKAGYRPGASIKPPGRMPFRWNQVSGPVYHTHRSRRLRAEMDTQSIPSQPDVLHIFEDMRERQGGRPATPTSKWPAHINRWGKVDLTLNTKYNDIKPADFDAREEGWWKDRAPMTQADALMQATSQAERFQAIHARASAVGWRRHQMCKLGQSMVNSIR